MSVIEKIANFFSNILRYKLFVAYVPCEHHSNILKSIIYSSKNSFESFEKYGDISRSHIRNYQ